MPALSVVMPVYNGGRYLDLAIESILAQSAGDFEFIIMEDGSTDNSRSILEGYAGRDSRIRLVADGTNRGITARLNQGVALASAPLIARMDADDISLPHRFADQLKALRENPALVLIGSRVIVIDPDGDELTEMGALSHEEIDSALMNRTGQPVYHPSVIFRKDAALRVGGYDESYLAAQDHDFFLKLLEQGRVENLAEPLLKYREHFSKLGVTRIAEQERAITGAILAAHRRRGTTPASSETTEVKRRPVSRAETHRKWGWWALQSGRLKSARKHALRAMRRDPLNRESARLVWCALRGR